MLPRQVAGGAGRSATKGMKESGAAALAAAQEHKRCQGRHQGPLLNAIPTVAGARRTLHIRDWGSAPDPGFMRNNAASVYHVSLDPLRSQRVLKRRCGTAGAGLGDDAEETSLPWNEAWG